MCLFAEFVDATSIKRLDWVKKSIDSYHPEQDPYKQLREGIVRVHTGRDHDMLDWYRRGKPNAWKSARYPAFKTAHDQFVAAHNVQCIGFRRKLWRCNGVAVNVKPDLGLHIDTQSYMVKLWFKEGRPTPLYKSAILRLLKNTCVKEFEGATPAIWDVMRGELLTTMEVTFIDPILSDAADAFRKQWEQLNPEAAKGASVAPVAPTGQVDLFAHDNL